MYFRRRENETIYTVFEGCESEEKSITVSHIALISESKSLLCVENASESQEGRTFIYYRYEDLTLVRKLKKQCKLVVASIVQSYSIVREVFGV